MLVFILTNGQEGDFSADCAEAFRPLAPRRGECALHATDVARIVPLDELSRMVTVGERRGGDWHRSCHHGDSFLRAAVTSFDGTLRF